MARIPIFKKDGSPTNMFWSDRLDGKQPLKTVYRTTKEGRVQRSTSIRYDATRKRIHRV